MRSQSELCFRIERPTEPVLKNDSEGIRSDEKF